MLSAFRHAKCGFALWDAHVSCCVKLQQSCYCRSFEHNCWVSEHHSVFISKITSLKSQLKPLQPLILCSLEVQDWLLSLSRTFCLWFTVLTLLKMMRGQPLKSCYFDSSLHFSLPTIFTEIAALQHSALHSKWNITLMISFWQIWQRWSACMLQFWAC